MNKVKKLEEYFYDLRFKDKSHLGLGDIRLTLAQQDEIVCMVLDMLEKNKVGFSEEQIKEMRDKLAAKILKDPYVG